MDEIGIKAGTGKQKSLAPAGRTACMNQRSPNSKENVTVSVTYNAAGDTVDILCIYSGKKNMAKEQFKKLPTDGVTGTWRTTNSENGWMTRVTFLEVLEGEFFCQASGQGWFLRKILLHNS